MSEEEPQPELEQIDLQVAWIGLEQAPIFAVNQLIAQTNQGEVFLTFGQVSPPVLVGEPESQKEQLQNLGPLSVRPVVRLMLTPARLKEIAGVINDLVARTETEDQARAAHASEESAG